MAGMIVYIYIDYLNIYINSSIIYSIKQLYIHKSNSTDIVITMQNILNK